MEDVAITVRGMSKRFGFTQAVSKVDFTVTRGEIFGLAGPDGAGKTTIMRMIAGVLPPDEGEIVVDGVNVAVDPEIVKLRISYMPQHFGLYDDLTVAENIYFYGELFAVPASDRKARKRQLLLAAGMQPFERRLAGQLSGGMKQKLGLICALIHTPRILILDEPTTGVDPVSRREFWSILYDLRENGVTILLSTAYMDEAERCSRLALLSAGQVRHCATPVELKRAMPGVLLAIVSPDPRSVRAALTGHPGILGMILMGDRIHVRVDDASRLDELRAYLSDSGFHPISLRVTEPGIEDVFVALLGRENTA